MSIKNELPDLEDMLKHPEKYETPEPKEVKVDEEALLKNIANVSFKPFDDGTRQFEILNDIEAPSVSDMQEEFNKLGDNFEIINSEEEIPAEKVADTNDFETLYDGKYVDLDKDLRKSDETNNKMSVGDPQNSDISVLQELELQVNENNNDNTLDIQDNGTEPDILEPVNSLDESLIEYPNSDITNSETESEAAKLLNKIKNIERQRRSKKNAKKEINNATINKKEQEKVKAPEFCILDNEKYSIINTTYFTDRMGCYLAKNDKGYCIVGFAGDSVFKIRYYEKLNTEKLQSRLSEKLEDGSARYIVRLGIHKFILNVKQNDMEVVMDLC